MADLSEDQKNFIKKAFELLDENHNGRISKHELTRAARVFGYNPTLKEAQKMIDEVDANGNGYIDFEEFAEMMSESLGALDYQQGQIDAAFRHLDKDGNGWISYDELKTALTTRGDKLDEAEFQKLVEELDVNKDGKIYYEGLFGRSR
ncbi:calmodulin [Plakobranchus ocellatus]|uniref:Calmodulin n=1 Tax=Plakobranchus ocellatus TaxID=259542 RepID=A0AAV4DL52_9GAST|nr:calmodulin [Plakobranchus ocellatus]